MRFKMKPKLDKSEWHKWFAWHPVFDGDICIWFERVWRKDVLSHETRYELGFSLYDYRLIESHESCPPSTE